MVFIILSGQPIRKDRELRRNQSLNSRVLPSASSAIPSNLLHKRQSSIGDESLESRAEGNGDVNLAAESESGERMSTDLSDPYFCPPRQLRQVQGRGPAFDTANKTLSGGLRFRPGGKKRTTGGDTTPTGLRSASNASNLSREPARPTSVRRSSSIYESINTPDSTTTDDLDEPFYSMPTGPTSSSSAMNHGKSPSWPVSTSDTSSRYEDSVCSSQGFHSRDPSWLSSRSEKELHSTLPTPSLSSKKPSEDSGIALYQFEEETEQTWDSRTHNGPANQPDQSPTQSSHLNTRPNNFDKDENTWFGTKQQFILLRPGRESGSGGEETLRNYQSNDSSPTEHRSDENSLGSNFCDSDTLRRAAAKNREVSQKLFRQYKEQQQRGSPRTGGDEGGRGEEVGGNEEKEGREDGPRGNLHLRHEDPHSNPYANASSMRRHSRRRSSLYTDSSGSSSGVGTLSSSSNHNEDKEALTRSWSVETFSGGGVPPETTSPSAWNKPQQRRNILSMVESEPGQYLPLGGMEDPDRRDGIPHHENREMPHHISTSVPFKSSSPHYVSHRGVSRKISNRKRVARDSQQKEESLKHSFQSSLPDLSANPHSFSPQSQDSLPSKSSPVSQEVPPGARIFQGGSLAGRSSSPIYAVPCKVGNGENMSVRTPPPLPSLPPPPLQHFQYTSSTPSLTSDTETGTMLGKPRQVPVAPPRPSKTPASPSTYSHQVWPQSSQSRRVPVTEPQSASPGLPPLPSKVQAVKPTVQVHPMCMDLPEQNHVVAKDSSLSIKVEAQNGMSNPSTPEKRSGPRLGPAPSPRPPVPKKPDFLSPLKQQRKTDSRVPSSSNESIPFRSAPSTTRQETPPDSSSSQNPSEKAAEYMEKSPRLSVLVKIGDERLRQILHPPSIPQPQPSSSNSFGSQGGNLDTHSMSLDSADESDSAYFSRAKFLVGMYARGPSPIPSSCLRDTSPDDDLEKKKWNLISSLTRKMKILDEEGTAIREEMRVNDKLGDGIFEQLHRSSISDLDYSKVKRLAEDTENITSLVLKLSGQIARVENGIQKLGTGASPAEKKLLLDRKSRLMEQMDEANHLRVNLDSRSEQVEEIVARHLDSESSADMKYYLQMKIKLQTDAKEIDDKLKLGREQKEALEMTLPPQKSSA